MRRILCSLLSVVVWGATLASQQSSFPEAEPESQNISRSALERLAALVRGYIEDEQVVGAELLVIKNRRAVLHEAFGWIDREEERKWPRNTICNLRSMTKPLTGTAIQMLVDAGEISLDDTVARYVPGFDNDKSRAITIEQLLTHTSGLPLTIVVGTRDYPDLITMANAVGSRGPEFEPGSKFWYSDAGCEVLGAIVEVVTDSRLEEFVRDRILKPLQMRDTFVPTDRDDPRWDRIASLYVGSPGGWMKFWDRDGAPFYPFAWGSQSLYGTPKDYARFLALWIDRGEVGNRRLLSPEAVERTLTSASRMSALGSDMAMPSGFPGLEVHYGQTFGLYLQPDSPAFPPAVIGHTGSDGTWAWAWPDRDLMILYFTQSRGQATGVRLEGEIDRLLIHPESEGSEEIPQHYRPYVGTYVANYAQFRNVEFTVLVRGGRLALDVPGQLVFELKDPDSDGKWQFALTDQVAVSFDRDTEGNVSEMKIHEAGAVFELPRGKAKPEREIEVETVSRYLGKYRDDRNDAVVEVRIQNGRLTVDVPDTGVFELYPPDDQGKWVVRVNPAMSIRFNEDEEGRVLSMTRATPGDELVLPRMDEVSEP